MPTAAELIACDRDISEVQRLIGADALIYQDNQDLVSAVGHGDKGPREFEQSCFTGTYITGDVSPDYLHNVSNLRSDKAKSAREENEASLNDLHAPAHN